MIIHINKFNMIRKIHSKRKVNKSGRYRTGESKCIMCNKIYYSVAGGEFVVTGISVKKICSSCGLECALTVEADESSI